MLVGWLAGWLTGCWLVGCLPGCLFGWLPGWQSGWQSGWLASVLSDWLAGPGYLAAFLPDKRSERCIDQGSGEAAEMGVRGQPSSDHVRVGEGRGSKAVLVRRECGDSKVAIACQDSG